jgi:hypothetical protein
MNAMTTIQSEYSEDRDLVNQLLGQAQMADAFAKFSLTVRTSKLNFVKENKLYRNLKGKKVLTVRTFLQELGKNFVNYWECHELKLMMILLILGY